MINFDALTLRAFILENADFLKGAFVQKVRQQGRKEVFLTLRKSGDTKHLCLNIDPRFFHVFLTDKLPDFEGAAAPMFCMLLRKYIGSSKIVNVAQPDGERIFELYFEYFDITGEKSLLCLACELMGKHADIILYDATTKTIIGCAHNVGAEKSRYRELAGNLPYIYPASQNKKSLDDISASEFEKISEDSVDSTDLAFKAATDFKYLTVPSVKNAALQNPAPSELYAFLKKLVDSDKFSPCISEDYEMFSLFELPNSKHFDRVNDMICEYFSFHKNKNLLSSAKSSFFSKIDTKIKKLKNREKELRQKIENSRKADAYKLKADILMTNPYISATKILKTENPFEPGQTVEIELDETLSVIENANRYYKLYKKSKTALTYAENMLKDVENELAALSEQRLYADFAQSAEEMRQINKPEKIKSVKLEPRVIEGYKVFVGKNSVQNDYLLSKIAAPEDIWFHPLNTPGAHVILKKNFPKEQVPDEVLLECALLAKEFSLADKNAKIPVIYTLRKYVKKATAKVAFVTYKFEKEIYC